MGVADWFSTFCANQRINSDRRATISARTARITRQLNLDLRGLDSEVGNRFYVGSYGRGTAIPSVSDVDLLYSLPTELYVQYNAHVGNGQSALLARVRSAIQKTYSSSSISGDGQVVVVSFNDGIVYEVLPAQPLVAALAEELRRHAVLHADETPVAMLKPGNGKTHRAYMWSYCTPSSNPTKAVVFDFSETRNGENVREFLRLDTRQAWQGTLVTDGFSGYRACVEKGVTSAQCMAHARRKFHELWANHGSEVGRQALRFHQTLFRIEREIASDTAQERRRMRQRKSRRVLAVFHRWLMAQRQLVPPGSATMRAIDYSLKRWGELTHFVDDGDVPISNNWVENHIRPIALGRSNWLFAGSLRAGKRAAAIMSLLHTARINGHEPYTYLRDVLERLPTHPASRIDELLPHRWTPTL